MLCLFLWKEVAHWAIISALVQGRVHTGKKIEFLFIVVAVYSVVPGHMRA